MTLPTLAIRDGPSERELLSVCDPEKMEVATRIHRTAKTTNSYWIPLKFSAANRTGTGVESETLFISVLTNQISTATRANINYPTPEPLSVVTCVVIKIV